MNRRLLNLLTVLSLLLCVAGRLRQLIVPYYGIVTLLAAAPAAAVCAKLLRRR